MSQGVVALVAALLVASAFGLWRRRTDGRFRATHSPVEPAAVAGLAADQWLSADDLGSPLGDRATLVQFSSEFCAPCRTTRVVLGDVASHTPGVVHVEVAAEERAELIRRFDVRRTPTLLVLDRAGVVRHRATGAPHREQVLAALASVGHE